MDVPAVRRRGEGDTSMSGDLIINARDRLRWHQRLLSDVSTFLLWAGWLWLWVPLMKHQASLAQLGARLQPLLAKLAATGGGLHYSVAAIVGTSGTLMVWNRLPARKARAPKALSTREYARHFALPEQALHAGRGASICVVHHDDEGRIVRLECREPAGELARLAS